MHKNIQFATQVALLEKLYKNKMINEREYRLILQKIKSDYNIAQITT